MNDETPGPPASADRGGEVHRPAQSRLTLVGVDPVFSRQLVTVAELAVPGLSRLDLKAVTRSRTADVASSGSAERTLSANASELHRFADRGFESVHTFGFGTQAGSATHSGARWISPLLRHSVEFPSVWIQKTEDARYRASRSRVRKLLDRLCGADPQSPPPRAVVVVAHPDDEAIGAGARLRSIPEITIVHVTDGAPRDPTYALSKGFTSRDAYALSRQDELTAALSVLGIPRDFTRCLDIVDGEATEHLVEITYRLAAVFDELRPEVAVTHSYEGGHTDHDATAFAVHLACGVLRREGAVAPVILELTSYHLYGDAKRVGEFLPYGDLEERTVELGHDAQQLKQRMYDCFASQRECLAAFPRDRERFRVAPRYVFTQPPHSGPLLYERVSSRFEGDRWRESAARALQRLRAKQRTVRG